MTLARIFLVAITAYAGTSTTYAQWPQVKTPGIPRLPNGKADLSAPAPRAVDGHPDLSGVWDMQEKIPCAPGGCTCPAQQFLNIAWGVKDGLPYRRGMAELAKARQQPPKIDEPLTRCLPVPAGGCGGTAHASDVEENRSGARIAFDPERIQHQLPPDLHGRTSVAGQSETFLGWLFQWQVGGRHLGRGNHRISRWQLARCVRRSYHR